MGVREIQAKSILRKRKKIDSWFISHYGMNLYRGCIHNCSYCDGRSEGYYVDGEFGRDVSVKVNALDVLTRELDPKRKRVPLRKSFFVLGGGVGDSYQPAEEKYRLSRGVLQILSACRLPVHVLTKSTLVKRDADILQEINERNRAIVSFSFSTVDKRTSAIFEPGVPPPEERLETICFLKERGIPCGMFLMPVIPFLTDGEKHMEEALRRAWEVDVDFVIFSGMTLKEGKQRDHFYDVLVKNYPKLLTSYREIFRENKWGSAAEPYYTSIHRQFNVTAKSVGIPVRIPPNLYRDILDENDLVIVILEHIDYLLRLDGKKSSFGYAAYSLSQLQKQLSTVRHELCTIGGISRGVMEIVTEILDRRASSLHERLLFGEQTS